MRQLITSLLMITYLATAIGFSCSFHYCGGSYHGICFTEDTEADCCGPMEDNDGCCEDKVVCAKHKDDHTPSAFKVTLQKVVSDVLPARQLDAIAHFFRGYVNDASTYIKGPAPPLIRSIPIYLFNRVLRL